MIKLLLTSVFSAFLFVSASAFADYSQTKNKADDKENSPKPVHSHDNKKAHDPSVDAHPEGPRDDAAGKHTTKNKDNEKASHSSGDKHPEGPRDDAAGEHVTGEKPRDSSQAK